MDKATRAAKLVAFPLHYQNGAFCFMCQPRVHRTQQLIFFKPQNNNEEVLSR